MYLVPNLSYYIEQGKDIQACTQKAMSTMHM